MMPTPKLKVALLWRSSHPNPHCYISGYCEESSTFNCKQEGIVFIEWKVRNYWSNPLIFNISQTVSNINKWNQVQEELTQDTSVPSVSPSLVIYFPLRHSCSMEDLRGSHIVANTGGYIRSFYNKTSGQTPYRGCFTPDRSGVRVLGRYSINVFALCTTVQNNRPVETS